MSGDVGELISSIRVENPTVDSSQAHSMAYRQRDDPEERAAIAKSAPNGTVSRVSFEMQSEGSVSEVFKADDEFVIWGPASVSVVDKENDRITAKALEEALPQLLKRSRLSYEHSDQIVGDILKSYETEQPRELTINGRAYERSEFPTAVLDLEGMEKGLFVAGQIYDDTQKAQDVRKRIESGDIDSYSISGEAVTTEMAVKDGQTFTDIVKLDLSAVTLCEEGMNQKAKFDVVDKSSSGLEPLEAASIAKSRLDTIMSDNDNDGDVQKFVDALDSTLDERLPEGELATKEDVENTVEEKLAQKEYSGDNTNTAQDMSSDPSDETDPTIEEQTSNDVSAGDDTTKADAYTTEELKSILPDDQFKAIEPLLNEKADRVDPAEDKPEEMVEPEPEPEPAPAPEAEPPVEPEGPDEDEELPVEASKSVDELDWGRLTESQKKALAKSGRVEKHSSKVRTGVGVGGSDAPAHAGDSSSEGPVIKADNQSVAADPAMRKFYDEDGEPLI